MNECPAAISRACLNLTEGFAPCDDTCERSHVCKDGMAAGHCETCGAVTDPEACGGCKTALADCPQPDGCCCDCWHTEAPAPFIDCPDAWEYAVAHVEGDEVADIQPRQDLAAAHRTIAECGGPCYPVRRSLKWEPVPDQNGPS